MVRISKGKHWKYLLKPYNNKTKLISLISILDDKISKFYAWSILTFIEIEKLFLYGKNKRTLNILTFCVLCVQLESQHAYLDMRTWKIFNAYLDRKKMSSFPLGRHGSLCFFMLKSMSHITWYGRILSSSKSKYEKIILLGLYHLISRLSLIFHSINISQYKSVQRR